MPKETENTYMQLSYLHLDSVVDEIIKNKEHILIDKYRQELSKKYEKISSFDEEYKIIKYYFKDRFTLITDNIYRIITYPDNYSFDFEHNRYVLIEEFISSIKRKEIKIIRDNKNLFLNSRKNGYQSFAPQYNLNDHWNSKKKTYQTLKILKTKLDNYKKKFKEFVLAEITKDRNKQSIYIIIRINKNTYPVQSPSVYIDDVKNIMLPGCIEVLETKINKFIGLLNGKICIYYLEEFVSYYLSKIEHLESPKNINSDNRLTQYNELVEYPRINEINNPEIFIGNIYDIISKMPKGTHIKNVETILRQDLIWRFKKYQAMLKDKYPNKKLLHDIQIAFHGTREERLHGIVEKGLIIPNVDNGLNEFTCGTRYGNGIYLSPDTRFSMHYCRGDSCLLVCAVLPGRKYTCPSDMWSSTLKKGYDSHESHDKTELILFDEAQVLPCIVIHFTTGDNYQDWWEFYYNKPKKLSYRDQMKTMNQKEKKDFLASFGNSILPYGFGKHKINKCEFLDVTFPDECENDDIVTWHGDMDNDNYNMFQKERH